MADSPFDFDSIVDRSNSGSEKWDRYKGRDIIPLWVADMDFRSPPAIIRALHERVDHGLFGYTRPWQGVTDAVMEHLERDFHWRIEAEWIVWLPGLVCGLNVLCRAVGEIGDDVVTLTPVYPPFLSAPSLSRRNLVTVPLVLRGTRWEADRDELERAITPRSRLLLLCSPHNPVGRCWTREELLGFADLAKRHNLVIGSDEIHAGLVLDQEKCHLPLATLSPDAARRTITLMAPSKTFNIPGLGCSFAIIPDQGLRDSFRKAKAGIVPHVNSLGYTATEAAYRHGGEWRLALIDYLRDNRDLVIRAVGRMPGLSVTPVEATYLAWIDARKSGIDHPARFFEQAGVGLSDGAPFGAPGFVRLNFGCPRPLLEEALGRMERALARP
ncbi:MalY/PatB family protein [Pelobacter propionicus]|uniref:cysteine-S-conjugate beta-lyase n=1 Tax=Pelobacter propionicus (strain DSM 2379 / NBRC 103807 / OttBd1) TaxID=338966 RepID=A1AQI6_PELPD|nr:PatB family C-S lyase [Pelobacter propionicus]ABK99606.1 aminotransferase, class I and II [Pelobacter propionicus DSM 2379]